MLIFCYLRGGKNTQNIYILKKYVSLIDLTPNIQGGPCKNRSCVIQNDFKQSLSMQDTRLRCSQKNRKINKLNAKEQTRGLYFRPAAWNMYPSPQKKFPVLFMWSPSHQNRTCWRAGPHPPKLLNTSSPGISPQGPSGPGQPMVCLSLEARWGPWNSAHSARGFL